MGGNYNSKAWNTKTARTQVLKESGSVEPDFAWLLVFIVHLLLLGMVLDL